MQSDNCCGPHRAACSVLSAARQYCVLDVSDAALAWLRDARLKSNTQIRQEGHGRDATRKRRVRAARTQAPSSALSGGSHPPEPPNAQPNFRDNQSVLLKRESRSVPTKLGLS